MNTTATDTVSDRNSTSPNHKLKHTSTILHTLTG